MPANLKPLSNERINIRPGVSILSILRHLNYKPWFALAEFVDNAVQSYLSNRARLEALHGAEFKLRVQIDIDSTTPPRISIRDNAAGIARADFPRAFRPAAIPPDQTGLCEFGMGMKSAACWFAPHWHVRTKALGESAERTVRFDVEQIVNDKLEELEISEISADPNTHFTEVVLDDLHHIPIRRTIGKIKEHLTDIYRVYVRDGLLALDFGGEALSYVEPTILRATYARDPEGQSRIWRKQIDFDLGGGLSVSGFAGLLDPMNTARSGFALFRRGRLIQGSGDEGYRPSLIFGQAGNFRWRRLFGELHLVGFEVSHTKDGFRWDENEQPFLELLQEHLDSQELPLLRQADLHRVQAPRNEVTEAAQRALARAVEAMQASLPGVLPQISDELPVETQTFPLDPQPTIASREFRIEFRGQVWLIRIELTGDPAQSEWLAMSDQASAGTSLDVIEIRVSMSHPFMVSFAQTDPDDVEALLRVAAGLALSEKLARSAGVRMAKTIRRNLNEILREALWRP
jgi:hypothetical protein